jgi:superfamily II DNA or RNA helicase
MLIIHTAYAGNTFYIWGEHSFTSENILADAPTTPRHPFAASAAELSAALERTGVPQTSGSYSVHTCRIVLPQFNGVPLPSSPLLGDVPFTEETCSLETFEADAVAVSQEIFNAVLRVVGTDGEKLPVPGIIFAKDTRFVLAAFEYAAVLAARGCFIPDMEKTEAGCLSQWSPLYLPKYHDEYSSYIRALPPVMKNFSIAGGASAAHEQENLATEILASLLDSIIRQAQSEGARGRRVDPDNAHEMWIRSLTWPKAPLGMWDEEMSSIYPQIKAWADDAKTGSGEPWRLFLRLGEPDENGNGSGDWTLAWYLQSVRDPSLIIPAARVWSPGTAERQWFESVGANPRRYLLQMLGQISKDVPAIASSLDGPCPVSCSLTTEELFNFLSDDVPALLDKGIYIQFPTAWGSPSDRPRLAVTGSVHDDAVFSAGGQMSLNDLIDVNWSISLGGDVLTADELSMLSELKTPLVNVRGRWVLLYRNELEDIIEGIKKLPQKTDRRSVLFASLSESYKGLRVSSVGGSPWLDSVRAVLTGTEPIKDIPQPEGFCGTLRPYQLRGLSWLAWLTKLGLGGCLADDMGLGKTIEALALLQTLRLHGETRPVLLVCPTSVIENWRREAQRFVPDMKTAVHHGTERRRGEKFISEAEGASLVITSYSLVHRDLAALSHVGWSGVILDEAQNIKNPDTRQAHAARSIPADWHVALTGTPVENHVGDLWSIMEFIVPGLLPNKARFVRDFLRPIQAGSKAAMEKIKRMTGPFILRRLKTDKEIITDLPQKIESEVFCPLGPEQASLYAAELSQLEERIADAEGIRRKGLVLSTITALKQICDHPALFLKDNSDIGGRSGKLARLAELAEEMLSAGDRALIFTQYAAMGELIKQFLQETFGRETLFLHGGVPREKRDEMVRRFQSGDKDTPQFFVLSIKAGGTGLNLTGANHVVLFDRWWNPAVEQQAVDRAYRIGQTSNVQVHYFCCKGTLEEKIEALIQNKKHVAESIITSGENWLTELSDDDLSELFALGDDSVEDIK